MGGKFVLLAPLVLLALLQVGVDGCPNGHERSLSDNSVPCGSSTCGVGAHCTRGGARPVCACLPGYSGDPLKQCTRIECANDSECRDNLTCVNKHCVDPCDGVCASNANCNIRQGILVCTCEPGYTGNPYVNCNPIESDDI